MRAPSRSVGDTINGFVRDQPEEKWNGTPLYTLEVYKCIPLKKEYYMQILAFSFFNFSLFTFSYKTLRAWNI